MAAASGSNQQAPTILGTNDRGIPNEGCILMNALKALIVPIVKTCLAERDTHEDSPIATSSNKDDPVLSALKAFVGRVVEAEIDRQNNGATSKTEGDIARRNSLVKQEHLAVPMPPSKSDWQVAYIKASWLLDRPTEYIEEAAHNILRHLRDIISNRWPIRMLWFNKTGSIKLIGRADVFSIVQTNLYHDLNHDDEIDPRLQYAVRKDPRTYAKKVLKYAILSHTWLQDSPGEITYKSWVEGSYERNSAGYQKLENFCRVSADRGLQFGWMDTICINKDSSSELDESIRSMYRWYEYSTACITYLAETSAIDNMHRDRWFIRGWTLQELVAPHVIFFYNRDWKRFTGNSENDRKDHTIVAQIEKGSRITAHELASFHENKPHISRRMQWASVREVTREEDTAYSLMGIFDVSMSTAYGEGAKHAFARLIKKIITNPGHGAVAMDIVNCFHGGRKTLQSAILPDGPSAFNYVPPAHELWQDFEPHVPMMITQRGLHISALLICGVHGQNVNKNITWGQAYPEHTGHTVQLLRYPFEHKSAPFVGILFAVLNHTVKNNAVILPHTCFAVKTKAWNFIQSSLQLEIPTDGSTFPAISDYQYAKTFSLTDNNTGKPLRSTPICNLEKNGLYLRTLYI